MLKVAKTSVLIVLLLTFLSAMGCITPRAAPAADFGTQQMPGLGLRPSDSIDEFDFTVEDDRLLHVAWLVQLRERPDADEIKVQVWYRQMESAKGRWRDPVLVTAGGSPPLRILILGDQLHLLIGRELKHFASNDGGRTWVELAQVVPTPRVQTFDAALDGGSIIVAYVARMRRTFGSQVPESVGVWTARLTTSGPSAPTRVGAFPGVSHTEPKLLISSREVRLFYAVSRIGRGAAPDQVHANLFESWSSDHGATWSLPQAIATLGLHDGHARQSGNGSISHLDAVRLKNHILIFYNAAWLYAAKSRDGTSWSDASTLIGVRSWLGPAQTTSVAAVASGDRGQLIWIDSRFQHSDRTLLNPWGLPWFLDADWVDNDVLALPLSLTLRPIEEVTAAKPVRLTRELSFAARVRAKASGNRVYVMWPGRARVGRHLDSAGKPSTIFFRSLPLE